MTDLDVLQKRLDAAPTKKWAVIREPDADDGPDTVIYLRVWQDYDGGFQRDDAALIVAAVNALPDLIAELRNLRRPK